MKIAYVAKDGKMFNSMEECLRHEHGPYVNFIGNISKIKRKKFVDEFGVHYPIRYITVAAPIGQKDTEFITLEIEWTKGVRMNGIGLKKGMCLNVAGCMKAYAYEKNDVVRCMLYMDNPQFSFLSPLKKRKSA